MMRKLLTTLAVCLLCVCRGMMNYDIARNENQIDDSSDDSSLVDDSRLVRQLQEAENNMARNENQLVEKNLLRELEGTENDIAPNEKQLDDSLLSLFEITENDIALNENQAQEHASGELDAEELLGMMNYDIECDENQAWNLKLDIKKRKNAVKLLKLVPRLAREEQKKHAIGLWISQPLSLAFPQYPS